MKCGPTRLPLFNIILMFIYLSPSSRFTYTTIAEWLIHTVEVPVDGTDLSGATAMMYHQIYQAISRHLICTDSPWRWISYAHPYSGMFFMSLARHRVITIKRYDACKHIEGKCSVNIQLCLIESVSSWYTQIFIVKESESSSTQANSLDSHKLAVTR